MTTIDDMITEAKRELAVLKLVRRRFPSASRITLPDGSGSVIEADLEEKDIDGVEVMSFWSEARHAILYAYADVGDVRVYAMAGHRRINSVVLGRLRDENPRAFKIFVRFALGIEEGA